MKRLVKLTLAGAFLLLFSGAAASAQQLKFAYVDTQELMQLVIKKDSVETKLQTMADDLRSQIEGMQTELTRKYDEYQKSSSTSSEAIKQTKMREIQELDDRMRAFAQSADEELSAVQQNLIAEVAQKIKAATEKVGARGTYFMVMDKTNMLYFDTKSLTDITAQVKKELGV